ncbi:MAG: NUDIX hydrolase [Clostridiales bacterium]|jgi:ADP-ribose pyrophosphatase|nr:NUDIX hydrolase [Clostridiales bacterium]
MNSYKIVARKEIYQGRIVNVYLDDVELPGKMTVKREIVLHHREGVGILPVDSDGGIYLVRQYRHPLFKHVLEIPAGIAEAGESPETCAGRELEEEIGYRAAKLTFLVAANNTVGVSNDKIHLYVAEGLTKTTQNLDVDEILEIEKYSLAACEEMIATGEIIDSKTILAIYAYKLMARE